MKKLLTTLSVLTLGTTTGNLGNSLNTSINTNNNINENNNEITKKIDYKGYDSYGPHVSFYEDNSDVHTLLNGNKYANSGEEFINKYQCFAFDSSSFFKVETWDSSDIADLLTPKYTSLIKNKEETFRLQIRYCFVTKLTIFSIIHADLIIGHDNNNIYFQGYENDIIDFPGGLTTQTKFDVNLNIVKFSTIFNAH